MAFFPPNVALQATMIQNRMPVCLDSGKYSATTGNRIWSSLPIK
jgi:hypothetical protein